MHKKNDSGSPGILVTGGHRGLGKAIALSLGPEAGRIVIHYRRDNAAAEQCLSQLRQRGVEGCAFAADLTKEKEVKDLIAKAGEFLDGVDILVNNVGPILTSPWYETEAADWERIFKSNFISALMAMRAVLPGMREKKWGRIINLGYSRVEHLGAFKTIAPYACAKTSLLILTRSAARTEAPFGITVNMVSPGLMEDGVLPGNQRIPAGRLGCNSDVTEAVRFLVSREAAYITGENLVVAGGWML